MAVLFFGGKFAWDHWLSESAIATELSQKAIALFRPMVKEVEEVKASTFSNSTSMGSDAGEHSPQYVISESGSSPAEYIIATLDSPFAGLNYELNSLSLLPDGDIQIRWKVHNITGKPIALSSAMRQSLSPLKLKATDYHTQYALPIRYQAQIPAANCLLSSTVPPFGRIECVAVVGPQFPGQPSLSTALVQVYLPGMRNGLRVFLNS